MAQPTLIDPVLIKLAAILGAALKQKGEMLTLAESCTGGLVSAALTDIAGSSAWFERGFVTYSNAAKIEMLGVSAETLDKFGAVSEQTAKEMALGALANSRADVAVSITGIAGPDGGTPQKPVGTVCFAWAGKHTPLVSMTKSISGNRQEVREKSAVIALSELIKHLAAH